MSGEGPAEGGSNLSDDAPLYAILERIDPLPLQSLNRAVAVAQGQEPRAGLATLEGAPAWPTGSYLRDAVLADLHHRAENTPKA